MKRSSWIVLGLMCFLIAGVAYMRLSATPRPTDEDQIRQLLADGADAIQQKNLRRVLSCISRDYKDAEGLTFESLCAEAIQAFRNAQSISVSLENTQVQVDESSAVVNTRASVTAGIQGSRHNVLIDRPLTLNLRRENVKHYLVLNGQKWRVTSISGLHIGNEFE